MKIAALVIAAVIALAAVVLVQGYVGRDALRDAQIAGCERAKKDRTSIALGWRTAEQARRAKGTPLDLIAAGRYAGIATGLEQRSRVNCAMAFPPVHVLGK